MMNALLTSAVAVLNQNEDRCSVLIRDHLVEATHNVAPSVAHAPLLGRRKAVHNIKGTPRWHFPLPFLYLQRP